MGINLSADYWTKSLELFKDLEAKLFYMLRDSLHAHTSQHIISITLSTGSEETEEHWHQCA
jgi:hypothetical protein